MAKDTASAQLDRSTLKEAAGLALKQHRAEFAEVCASARAIYASKKQGFLWWKRVPTTAEVDNWFNASLYDDGFSGGFFEPSYARMARAHRLLELAETSNITDIRIPEVDIHFLREFLNERAED